MFKSSIVAFQNKIPDAELMLWLKELNLLLSSNIPILEVLYILNLNTHHSLLKQINDTTIREISNGNSLAESLHRSKKYFEPIFLTLIEITEQSGKITEGLLHYIEYKEKQVSFNKEESKAILYPCFVLVFASLVIFFFITIFSATVQQLLSTKIDHIPWVSQVVFQSSLWINQNIISALLAFSFGLFMMVVFFAKGWFWYFIPGYYRIQRLKLNYFFALIMNLAMTVRLDYIRSLELFSQIFPQKKRRKQIKKSILKIVNGDSLYQALKEITILERDLLLLVRATENLHTLVNCFQQISQIYFSKYTAQRERFFKLLEPILLAFISLLIAGVILALYIPLFSIGRSDQLWLN